MQSCQAVIRNESEILNMGMLKPPKVTSRQAGGLKGAVSAPAGYGATPRSKKYVSKMKKKYYLIKLKDMLITWCCVPRTFLGTYKLLTDDFPIVQAFWWNIVFNPWFCMILYFKHIIHIDDFPFNGHPASVYYAYIMFLLLFIYYLFITSI